MIIYLVWTGEYSDAQVEAVYSSRDQAKRLVAHLNGPDKVMIRSYARIEVRRLDERAVPSTPQSTETQVELREKWLEKFR